MVLFAFVVGFLHKKHNLWVLATLFSGTLTEFSLNFGVFPWILVLFWLVNGFLMPFISIFASSWVVRMRSWQSHLLQITSQPNLGAFVSWDLNKTAVLSYILRLLIGLVLFWQTKHKRNLLFDSAIFFVYILLLRNRCTAI